MSTQVLAYADRQPGILVRVADYVELTKPRIATLVLVTVAMAAFVAGWGPPNPWLLFDTLLGTALVAASASALNQWLERVSDGQMQRTCDRPLPAGRLGSAEVLAFSAVTIVLGFGYLALAVNWLTAALGLLTWFTYVWIYTPLKRITPANTAVGAVAGALPVLMGWAAVDTALGLKAFTLFLIVFLWQFPHFMAIAWIYRQQYAAAGLRMLPVVDPSGRRAVRRPWCRLWRWCRSACSRPCWGWPAACTSVGRWCWASASSFAPCCSCSGSTNRPPGGCCGLRWCICRPSWCC